MVKLMSSTNHAVEDKIEDRGLDFVRGTSEMGAMGVMVARKFESTIPNI